SLLRDSYVDISDRELNELIAYFAALHGVGDAAEFRRRFDVMAVQRNLKALGTFGYQTITRQNPVYIQYIPRTLRYARTNLETHSRSARLRGWLAAHVEELQWSPGIFSGPTVRRLDVPLPAPPAGPRSSARNRRARIRRRGAVRDAAASRLPQPR